MNDYNDGMDGSKAQIIKVVKPTYIMAPTEDERFKRKQVVAIVSDCLKLELEDKEFDEEDAKEWCISIVESVKRRIRKETNFPRYKIIVQSAIGQQKQQDIRLSSRCLWDNDNDNHASAVFNNVLSTVLLISQP